MTRQLLPLAYACWIKTSGSHSSGNLAKSENLNTVGEKSEKKAK